MKSLYQKLQQFIHGNPTVLAFVLLLGFNYSLTIFRICYSSGNTYKFLVWNIFLACLPFVFMQVAIRTIKGKKGNLLGGAMFFLAALFLPNSPYIITDLFHLTYWKNSAPLWFDTLLIFSYAMTGVALFYVTLLLMERFLTHYLPSILVQLSLLLLLFLNAFGIYLGRYMRFNSWDIVSNPIGLLQEILERFTDPYAHPRTWGLTLGYGLMFVVGFYCIKLFQQSSSKPYEYKLGDRTSNQYNI